MFCKYKQSDLKNNNTIIIVIYGFHFSILLRFTKWHTDKKNIEMLHRTREQSFIDFFFCCLFLLTNDVLSQRPPIFVFTGYQRIIIIFFNIEHEIFFIFKCEIELLTIAFGLIFSFFHEINFQAFWSHKQKKIQKEISFVKSKKKNGCDTLLCAAKTDMIFHFHCIPFENAIKCLLVSPTKPMNGICVGARFRACVCFVVYIFIFMIVS